MKGSQAMKKSLQCFAAGGWVTSPRPARPQRSSQLNWPPSRFLSSATRSLPPALPPALLSRRRHSTSPALQSQLALPR